MSGHTPGPWSVRASFSGSDVLHITSAADENIAAVRTKANARLIAAAPDLLASLRAILFQVAQGKVLERDACVTQARSVIAGIGGVT
jgi:hypothetical protein